MAWPYGNSLKRSKPHVHHKTLNSVIMSRYRHAAPSVSTHVIVRHYHYIILSLFAPCPPLASTRTWRGGRRSSDGHCPLAQVRHCPPLPTLLWACHCPPLLHPPPCHYQLSSIFETLQVGQLAPLFALLLSCLAVGSKWRMLAPRLLVSIEASRSTINAQKLGGWWDTQKMQSKVFMSDRMYDDTSQVPPRPPCGTQNSAVECRSPGRVAPSLIITGITIFIPRWSGVFLAQRHTHYATTHTLLQS